MASRTVLSEKLLFVLKEIDHKEDSFLQDDK
jgi:hypothetical protein